MNAGGGFRDRECQDCEDKIHPRARRFRCKCCGLLVCGWCIHHVHNPAVQDRLKKTAAT